MAWGAPKWGNNSSLMMAMGGASLLAFALFKTAYDGSPIPEGLTPEEELELTEKPYVDPDAGKYTEPGQPDRRGFTEHKR